VTKKNKQQKEKKNNFSFLFDDWKLLTFGFLICDIYRTKRHKAYEEKVLQFERK
jgi:hypothetical protein